MTRYWLCLLAGFILFQNYLTAQDKSNFKFGKVTAADFDLSKFKFDSGADAVVIADVGNTSFEGNNKGDFTLVFNRHIRVKIINKNGFDIATQTISLYSDDQDQEQLTSLKASTYNLENGVVEETKLDEKSVFTSKVDRDIQHRKFTMPALREGSVFEISYTIKSDFYTRLRSWNFQGAYPCLWSDYQVAIPVFFSYMSRLQGDAMFEINSSNTSFANYTVRSSGGTGSDNVIGISAPTLQHRWLKKNIPALKEERYTTTLFNHLSRVSFQLHYIQYGENSERHNYMSDWFIASDKLLQNEHFGVALDFDNRWMTEPLQPLLADSHSSEETAHRIYLFIRDHFTCTDHDGWYTTQPLKDVFKKRAGNVAEINLLLVAMLRHEGVAADPVILSTRDNGYTDQSYPLISEYNYVICRARLNSKLLVNLDASWPLNAFGRLPAECYNGLARVINKERPDSVNLDADSLHEKKVTTVFITSDEKGNTSGTFKTLFGMNESYELRKQLKETTEKDYFKKIQASYGEELELQNQGIDSVNALDFPVLVHYDLNFKGLKDNDLIYFNPILKDVYTHNPFTSAIRKYPVEMPYTTNDTYIFNMQIPEGYTVEELPKSARMMYNEDEGYFEYLIGKSEDMVQLRVTLKLTKAYIPANDYSILRDFYAGIVKKESEQIVFKKK